jgi:hypothetical protein
MWRRASETLANQEVSREDVHPALKTKEISAAFAAVELRSLRMAGWSRFESGDCHGNLLRFAAVRTHAGAWVFLLAIV